ncbi:prolyl oligopeptidase family domain-containing protein [Trichoderma breve]|uniref:Dipeptidyl-peptidase V n=1 Tax=Trichoderma breve TaxID=2034170 RepID=A0A9W9EE83_9HYPO|nr:prolyl oligopeptidase family domain-containing protein [Trichoderma breve]KAJ4865167.1 prolyl oligopeptidase family domain-containing protein [Trichoderma breve]
MVRVKKLTPEVLLSDPRRGPAVPNRDGTHALYTVSAHALGDRTTHEVRILDIKTGSSTRLSNDPRVHDAVWIPGTELDILYLRSAEKGRTQVMVASAGDVSAEHYMAAEIDAPVSNLKLKELAHGSVAFVVIGLVGDSGLYNQEAVQRGSTARIYDAEIPIWNASHRPNRCSLWYNELVLCDRHWTLQGELHNLIDDIDLEAPSRMYTDVPCNDFDICRDGIAFAARNLRERGPDGSPATSIYFASLHSFSSAPYGIPRQIFIPTTFEPALITNVRFTPNSSSIGFLYTAHEDPYNTRLFLSSVSSLDAFDVFDLVTCADDEDQNPPRAFEFAGSSDSVILRSHQLGHETLSLLMLEDGAKPSVFFTGSSCSAFYPLTEGGWDFLLTTSSSFVDSSLWQIVQVSEAKVVRTISSATKNGAKFGLSSDMVTEIWCEGANRHFIHCWMIRPRDFDETKEYPWVLMPNGSPAMAWNNEWSTTNNFAAWASQDYIIILPNIAGSSGYGLEFTRRIRNQRGDEPFQDLLSLIDYLENVPYLDKAKATVVGSSSATYLVNKLLGHEVAKKFCCAVYQSGTIDPPVTSSHKEPVFDNFDKLDPSYQYTESEMIYENDMARSTFFYGWKNAPPTLIIHGEKDKQCSITEALTAFNSLQAQGVPSRLLTFPDEGHVATKPENTVMWYDIVFDWVKRCVDGDVGREDIF